MRFVAGVTCLVALGQAAPASAATEQTFVLEYEPPALAACPTEAALEVAVSGELGYDPWDPVDDRSSPRIVVTIRPGRDRVHGRVEMLAPDGKHLGARELEAPRCGELSQAITLAIAVAIDPLRLLPVRPKPQPVEPHVETEPDIKPTLPPEPGSAMQLAGDLHLRVAFGVQASVGLAPGPTVGFMGRVGFVLRRWSLAVELRGDLPGTSDEIDGGRVTASTMAAFLVPCVEHRIVAFCVFGGAGAQEVGGEGYVLARSSWAPYVAVGARIEAAVPLNRVLALLVRVDLEVPLTRTELYVGTERPVRVYRTSPLSNSFGLALSTR
ncbi:MAG TPA: hypothetical protein VN947_01705 [Polyangia bacterium]|nr:hypothetical protein [Polyangia bacterium]